MSLASISLSFLIKKFSILGGFARVAFPVGSRFSTFSACCENRCVLVYKYLTSLTEGHSFFPRKIAGECLAHVLLSVLFYEC